VLSKELAIHYEGFVSGRRAIMPELPIQYADYASWQRKWLQGEVLETQLAYWKEHLAEAPLLELPLDRPRPAMETFRGAAHVQFLSRDLTKSLARLSRCHGATVFMTLSAAFDVILAHQTGQKDIVVGTDLANRTSVETEPLIGCFVNLLVLRTNVSGDPSFPELLARVREVALTAYAHQDLPFDKLVEELRPGRMASRNPLVQVLFVQQNIPGQECQLPGLKLSSFGVLGTSRFDLTVFITERDEGLCGTWLYNRGLFEPSTIERMADRYETLLTSIAAKPDTHLVSLFAILDQANRQERIVEEKEFEQTARLKLTSRKSRGRQFTRAAHPE